MRRRLLLPLLALILGVVPGASTQTTTSVLEGRVYDPSGAVLPGTQVDLSGATRSRRVTTDGLGFYRVAALPAATYTVTVSRKGFQTKVVEGVLLTLDQTASLDITLEVAGGSETITVTGVVSELASMSVRELIDARTIESIPLNGRNYLDLIRLAPGVVVNHNARSDLTGLDTRGSILGERAGNAAFLIDGLANNDDFHGGALQSFTQDAIREFEVIEAGYKAEFGDGSGGIVNVVTRSGSNRVQGSAFLYLRNDALDSANVAAGAPPELARYDFGGTLAGPVRQNRSWFFGSAERVREDRASVFPQGIPALLSANEDFTRQPQTADVRVFGRYDQQVGQRHDLRATLSWSRVRLLNELAFPTSLPSASRNNLTHTWMGTVSLTSVFNPGMVLDTSLGVRSQDFDQNQEAAAGLGGSVFFLDDGSAYDFGPPPGSGQTLGQRYYSGRAALSLYRGDRHSVKMGIEYTRTIADGANGPALQDVIVTVRPLFDLFGLNSFQIVQGLGFANAGDSRSRLRNHGISLYAQDDWRLGPKLALSAGLRYDYDSTFSATANLAPRLGLVWSPDPKTVIQASWGIFYDRYRLGLAQPVPEFGGFNGHIMVELDYPRLANDALLPFPGTLGAFAFALADPNFLNTQFGIPPGTLVTAGNVQSLTGMTPSQFTAAANTFLNGFGAPFVPVDFSPTTGFLRQEISGGFQDEIRVARPFRTPHNHTFTAGVQREVAADVVMGAHYVHRRIQHILGVRITNLAPESRIVGSPITTDGGPLQRTYGPWYDGTYDALILSLQKRFSRRFQLHTSYTFAHSTDNLLNPNLGIGIGAQAGAAVPTDNNNINFDRGNSDLSVPHGLVTWGIVEAPGAVVVSGVLRATSGVHFSAEGTFVDYDGDGISSGRPANTQRNQFRGPAFVNLDLRVEKRFRLGERWSVSGLVEFFNLTNQANPRLIDAFFPGGMPGPSFGTVRVPLPGREIQLGARFQF
ncbi:MAG: TonB-dependent receptor [Terriglobales bacterium]